jgi:hypothetical protein
MSNHSRRLARWSAFGAAMLAVAGGLTAASARQTSANQPGTTPPAGLTSMARQSSGCPYVKIKLEWYGSAYIAGYSNATKQNESVLIGTGIDDHPKGTFLGLHNLYGIDWPCKGILFTYVVGVPDYDGKPELPPTRVTVLSFGFMPTTVTLELTEVPLPGGCRDVEGHQVAPPPIYTCLKVFSPNNPTGYVVTGSSLVEIHVLSLSANGTPVQVGPGCQTVAPVPLVVIGRGAEGYNVTTGGPLIGHFDAGPFKGCGTTENLDPLVDSALAGVRNLVKITQGPTCAEFVYPPGPPNSNCRVAPGRGHIYGVPKYYPVPLR